MLDISKAYDCINYDILIKKLGNAGIRGEILNWFRSYLTGRMQGGSYTTALGTSCKWLDDVRHVVQVAG